jgi:hypothetical protein
MQFAQVKRRDFITLLGGAAAAPSILRPLGAHAQQPAVPVGRISRQRSPDLYADRLRAFRQGLKESGYICSAPAERPDPPALKRRAGTCHNATGESTERPMRRTS